MEKYTWLIQRLGKPYGPGMHSEALNAMAFGGGGSGLTPEAMAMLSKVFSFDYMGAAEFEWGALPKSLQPFHAADKVAFSFVVGAKEQKGHWKRGWKGDKSEPLCDRTMYVLCKKGDEQYAEHTIRQCALGKQELKEPTLLPESLDPRSDSDKERVGWYELNNGFFFFTDRTMWEQTCTLFGVET